MLRSAQTVLREGGGDAPWCPLLLREKTHTGGGNALAFKPPRCGQLNTIPYTVLWPAGRVELGDALLYGDAKVANRDFRDFGWEIAHAAVTRRPPISLYTRLPPTGGYAYDVGVWDSFMVQGPFSVAPCQTFEIAVCWQGRSFA
jgi:hypothetical protein